MPTFTVETSNRLEALDVTDRVERALPAAASGAATVFVRHTTAAVTVNEAEAGLLADLETFLADAVDDGGWAHDRVDDNADGHLRATLVGPSVALPVSDGTLDLGRWQSVLLVECDGPRERTLDVRWGGSSP